MLVSALDSKTMNPGSTAGFVLFGTAHVLTLVVIAVVAVGVPLAAARFGTANVQHGIAFVIGCALPVYEVLKIFVRAYIYDFPFAQQLPFHLCSLALFLIAYLLIRRSYPVFEIAYFWALGGTLPALLTPDLRDGFPSLAYLTFFTGHGLIMLGIVYAIVVFRFRPTIASVGKTLVATVAYLPVAALINVVLGTNFLYLRQKPAQATIIDFLGPWPWYIGSLMLLGAAICLVLYLPFALAGSRRISGSERDIDG